MPISPTVFLVDDDQAFFESLVELISSIGLKIERFPTDSQFLEGFDASRPGCVLVDLGNTAFDGQLVIEKLSQFAIAPPVLVFTDRADVTSVVRAFHLGATGFLEKKHIGRTELLDTIQTAIKQDDQRRANYLRREEFRARYESLTPSEQQVLDLLLRGNELLTIATELKVSRRTIENRRASVMKKLGVSNFSALVQLVARYGNLPANS